MASFKLPPAINGAEMRLDVIIEELRAIRSLIEAQKAGDSVVEGAGVEPVPSVVPILGERVKRKYTRRAP